MLALKYHTDAAS